MKHALAILLLLAVTANAETIFVSQSGSGSGSGLDASNRASLAFVNNSSNWGAGPGKVSPGDTVSLSGTFSSQLIIPGSGTSGNIITILFESGAEFAKPIWAGAAGAAIYMSAKSFITIDGGTNGTIRCTANGPGLANQADAVGIEVTGCNDITIRNMIIKDIYDRPLGTFPNYPTDQARFGEGIHGVFRNNIVIENCDISDGDTLINYNFSGTFTGFVIRNNFLHRCNHAIGGGTVDDNAREIGTKIYGNRFDEFSYWRANPGQDAFHLDGIIFIHESPNKLDVTDGMEIYNNVFGPDIGGPPWPAGYLGHVDPEYAHNTAAIYVDTYVASQFINGKIYNNTFLANPNESWTNGHVSAAGVIANNTFIGGGGGRGIGVGDNSIVRNNLFYNIGNAITLGQTLTNISTDYNLFYGLTPGNSFYVWPGTGSPLSGIYGSLASWQSAGFDTHSTTAQPLLDSNYVPTAADTAARDQGVSMSTYFTTDQRGVSRPQQTAWDKGAFEFAPGGDAFPLVSTVTIPSAGNTAVVLFSEPVKTNTGGAGGWTLSMSGGAVTMTMPSIPTLTNTVTCTLSRNIGGSETGTVAYTQPGNGIEDSAGQDLASFSGVSVINQSAGSQVATPVFAPVSGPYFGSQSISITTSTPGDTIRYTIDGTDPTAISTVYVSPIPISTSTTFKAKGFLGGFTDSVISTASYEIGTWVGTTSWKGFAVPQQTGTFTWSFRASAALAANDSVVGLSSISPTNYPDLACIMRFNPSGAVDAFNGAVGGYAAVNAFTYIPGTTYQFVVTVNVAAKTYSATVSQIGGSPTTIATNYTFRQQAVELDNVGIYASNGGTTVSQMSFGGVSASIPTLISATVGSTGLTLTLGFSETVNYGLGGNGGWTINASRGAATLAPTASPTSFTVSRVIAIGETGTISYVQPGDGVESISLGDLATLTGFAFNNQSSVDLTAPTPNPMSFSATPSTPTSFSVTMTASLATDASTPPVEYYFDETSGNVGGTDSGWQTSRTYTNSNLSPGIQYTYRVLARDSSPAQNQTTPSSSFNVTTPIIAGARVITPSKTVGAGFLNP